MGSNKTRYMLGQLNKMHAGEDFSKQKHLSYQHFNDYILTNTLFTGCDLTHSSFENADLTNANLIEARLSYAAFPGANLTRANLTNAWLFYTQLQGAILNETIFGEFETNYAHGSYKLSKHTSVIFFTSAADIPAELNRLAAANNGPQSTLQAMVAHSLVNQLAMDNAVDAITLLTTYKNHPFFNAYDWMAHAQSLVRGLVRQSTITQNNDAGMSLCVYFLLNMPKLTSDERDLLRFFTTKERKDTFIQCIEKDQRLQNELNLEKLQKNDSAFTHILNTRRHLFPSERKANETKHSQLAFSFFRDQSNVSLNSSQEQDIRMAPAPTKG